MLVYVIIGVLLCTGFWCYGQENKNTEITIEDSINVKSKNESILPVEKNDSYLNNMANTSKRTNESLTDDTDDHDDIYVKVKETKPYNIKNADIQMDDINNFESKILVFNMANDNNSYQKGQDNKNTETTIEGSFNVKLKNQSALSVGKNDSYLNNIANTSKRTNENLTDDTDDHDDIDVKVKETKPYNIKNADIQMDDITNFESKILVFNMANDNNSYQKGQDNKNTETTIEGSFNVKLKNQSALSVEKNDSYLNNIANTSKRSNENLTDETDNHDDIDVKFKETKPHNITIADIQMDDINNFESKILVFNMANDNNSYQKGQDNKNTETTIEGSFNVKLKNQSALSVKKNDSYLNNIANTSKRSNENLTDETDNHDDIDVKFKETKPYNITNADIQMDDINNFESKILVFNMANDNNSYQKGQYNKNTETTIEGSFNVKLKNQSALSVEKNDSYVNNIANTSKRSNQNLTDETDNDDDIDVKFKETNPYNITNADIQMDDINNLESKIRVFNMANDNNSHQNEIVNRNTDERHILNNSSCSKAIGDICTRIADIRMVACGDGTFINLEQLCNGVLDCSIKTDESNCNQRVIEAIQLANDILLDTANLTKCLPRNADGHLFSDDFKLWQNGLNMQKVCYTNNWVEISSIITSMSNSFESHICLPIDDIDIVAEDFFKLEDDLDNLIDAYETENNLTWSPTSCTCNRQFCKLDFCDSRCKRICWQVYTLDHWGCQSVTGDTSISLDNICDGKIDCVDETDEKSCMIESSTYKHKADTIYDELLQMLTSKSFLLEFERNNTEKLADIVRQLQNLTIKTVNPDLDTIKTLRNDYFALLVEMFKDLWSTSSSLREINYAHDHLLLLNVNMAKALKHSYTGNKYIVLSTQCSCKDGVCASVVCSNKCNRFCFAEPILTNYTCDADNTSVSIKDICNGEKQCSNGEDEKDCRHETCRARHLDKLRINVQKATTSLTDSGFYIPDLIISEDWKVKIAQILEIAENQDPNRKMLDVKVSQVLHELVLVYSSVTATSQSHDLEIQEFKKASNIVKLTLKTCRK